MTAMTAPLLPATFTDARCADVFESDRADDAGPGTGGMAGFVAGTRIATPMGYVAIERLSAGDRVLTVEGRHARLVRTGLLRVPLTPQTAPVRVGIGMLNNMRPLRLGQGQRLRGADPHAGFVDGPARGLLPARALVDEARAVIEDGPGADVTYVHLMFERPEMILAENVACEALVHDPDAVRQDADPLRLAA
jgi:hypothetical protein